MGDENKPRIQLSSSESEKTTGIVFGLGKQEFNYTHIVTVTISHVLGGQTEEILHVKVSMN